MSTRVRWGCVAVLAYPLVEIALAVLVASIIGWWWVFMALVVFLALGLGIVRYALSATGQAWSAAMTALRTPTGERLEITATGESSPVAPAVPATTSLLVPAGLLIAVPGFLTTAIGLVLLLPPVRGRIAARIERAMRRGMGPMTQAD